MEEAESANELFRFLDKFNFQTTKGHLKQAISNHSSGDWASANGQIRTFFESLLKDISKKILPDNPCNTAASAISLLSKSSNPPFLKKELNEVSSNRRTNSFIDGFWNRLHPEGNHPGLSSEEDSTFRYHISIVMGRYLLDRLNSYPH